ncbi:MAG: sigma-70 family RNA polymerase sigma factor [Lachnospiraceae bacterium]|nr:sigma-70 family RNA polymerase sigma factor [Lachnospiraceae bacterium]
MEDCAIVGLYWDRDEQAIPATSEKYGRYCTSIAKNILGNIEDAEECVNDTYLNAWNSMPPHKPDVLSTFLGKITRNLSLNRYKYNTAEKRGGGEAVVVLDELSEVVSDTDIVEQEIERKELVNAINTFLDTLDLKKRSIFICRYWYFDSVEDIATSFGMTENNVSVILNRLRKKLQQYLSERGFEL